jgi:hypothetical protein
VRRYILAIAKRVLPGPFVQWYRRRRAARRYLKALGYELYDRQTRLSMQEAEGRVAAAQTRFYGQFMKDVLERTDLILQELDRRIEGVSTRHGAELATLRREVAELRARLEARTGADPAAVEGATVEVGVAAGPAPPGGS